MLLSGQVSKNRVCKHCGCDINTTQSHGVMFCSIGCYNQFRYRKVSVAEIISDYQSGLPLRQVAIKHKKSGSYIARILKRNNVSQRILRGRGLQFKCDENSFNLPLNEEKAYWIGFIAADGCVRKTQYSWQFSIGCKDLDQLEKLKVFLKSDHVIKQRIVKKYPGKQYYELVICSKPLCDSLGQYGIVQRKSKIFKPQNISLEYTKAFLRGLIDGDGWISISKQGKIAIGLSGTSRVCDLFKKYYKLENKISNRTDTFSIISVAGKSAKPIISDLYANNVVSLNRKYEIAKAICPNLN